MKIKNRLLISLILLSFSFLFTLIICESILRICYKKQFIEHFSADERYQLDNQLIYSFKPNKKTIWSTGEFVETFQINSLGFRDDEFSLNNKPNTIRIVAVGDSFTAGHGIPQNSKTYPKLLETELRNQFKQNNIEVINAGTPGYTPDQEYRLIKTRILKLNPNIIIWNLYPGDIPDLTGNLPSLYDVKNNQLVPLSARFNWLYIQSTLFLHTPNLIKSTYLFDFVESTLPKIELLSRKPFSNKNDLTKWGMNKILLEIQDVNITGSKNSFKFFVIILPSKYDFKNKAGDKYRVDLLKIINELRKEKISVYDLTEDIKQKEINMQSENTQNNVNVLGKKSFNPLTLFFEYDTHPNQAGTQLFASYISNYLITDYFKNK